MQCEECPLVEECDACFGCEHGKNVEMWEEPCITCCTPGTKNRCCWKKEEVKP